MPLYSVCVRINIIVIYYCKLYINVEHLARMHGTVANRFAKSSSLFTMILYSIRLSEMSTGWEGGGTTVLIKSRDRYNIKLK